jgi:hypothetical protein
MVLADTAVFFIGGIGVVLEVILLIITVSIASRKGHSGILFGIFSIFCPFVALIVALAVRPRR